MPNKKTTRNPSSRAAPRLSKDEWLSRSMAALAQHGPSALTLKSLTRLLGVTTGSFYWHFGNHEEFLSELTNRYIEEYTTVVVQHLDSLDATPREALEAASRLIISSNLGSMDVHFRSLATSYPMLVPKLRAMDEMRVQVIEDLYRGMGFSGRELSMRVHTFVVLHSMEDALTTCPPPEQRLAMMEERLNLLLD